MFAEPSSAQDQEVEMAVVVVVGLHQVESAQQPVEVGRLGPVRKGAVPPIAEKAQLSGQIRCRDEEIEIPVAVEVVGHGSTRKAEGVQSKSRSHIDPVRKRCLRFKGFGRNPMSGRHLLGILPQGHIGDVEQPAGT